MVDISVNQAVRISGKFRVVKKIGEEVTYDTGWQDNLITDAGLMQLASKAPENDCTEYLHLSSNNETPLVSEVLMKDVVAVSNSNTADYSSNVTNYSVNNVVGDEYFTKIVKKYFVPKGKTYVAAKIYLNVGNTSAEPPFSCALIKDLDGVNTTISVLAKEDLYVYYEVRQYFKLKEQLGEVTFRVREQDKVFSVKSKPYNIGGIYWKKACPVLSSSGTTGMNNYWHGHNIRILNGYPSDFISETTVIEYMDDYSSNNAQYIVLPYNAAFPYDRKCAIKIKTNGGNIVDGIKYFCFYNTRGTYVFETLDAAGKGIPKTSYDELTLTFNTSVARYVEP